ncbi:hypothetical protein [Halomarina ordinaria]|uniref:Universal stress protein n=1 Tax=Halomarina ordinaria TaxID=3033939 RepID=A0ABD5U5I0_9EURY|nr:hypothetical protein [Halomarina sp. PSRA2]
MDVLVPVRYPLTDRDRRALDRAADLAADPASTVLVFHMNPVHLGTRVTRDDLREAVGERLADVNADYAVRSGARIEDTLSEAVERYGVDVVVLTRHPRRPLAGALLERLDLDVDVVEHLREHVPVDLVVVE